MYKYRSRRRKSFIRRHGLPAFLMAVGAIMASFGFLMPANSDVDANARVFTEGLNIKLDRSSPAYAALEDSWVQSGTSAAAPQGPSAVSLMAGTTAGENVAQKIQKANLREQSLYAQERASKDAMSQAMAQAAAQIIRNMAERFQTRPEVIEAVQNLASNDNSEQQIEHEHQNKAQTISLTKLRISREELIGSLFLPIAKSDEANMPAQGFAVSPRRPNPAGGAGQQPSNDSGYVDNQRAQDGQPTMSGEPGSAAVLRQVVISGPLEFADGLGFSNPLDRIVIYREIDGEALESGAVWLREGRYEIFVEETVGVLIAELRTPYGDVMGRGIFDLSKLPIKDQRQRKVDNVRVAIKPVPQGITGRVTAARSDGQRPIVRAANIEFRDLPFNANTNREGRYEQQNLLEGSSAIVKATRPGYWGTLAFAHAGAENDIEIFPNQDGQMIKHLVTLSRSSKVPTDAAAIIWGRVTRAGKPLAGARVELPTTAEVVQPIYFNSAMVPDPSLRETTANGLYAFFPVVAGAHAVQAITSDKWITEPLVFPAEQKTVSRVDIETSADRKARVRVFDAFRTDHPLRAEIVNPGAQSAVAISQSGVGEIKYAGGRGILILDTDSGSGYERVRMAMSRDRRVIYVPMVQTVWLEKIRGAMRINPAAHSGTIVGFVQGTSPYKIAMEERSLLPTSRVVYFNSRGEVVPQEYGEPGGGFVVFNVPEGFRTVTVQPSGSTKIYSSVALVESKVTSVISHWVR